MKQTRGRRIRKRGGARAVYTTLLGVLAAIVFLFASGADNLDDALDDAMSEQFIMSVLAAEIGGAPLLEYSDYLAAQSVVLVSRAADFDADIHQNQMNVSVPLHGLPPKDANDTYTTVAAPSQPNAAELDPNVRTITIEVSNDAGYDAYDGVYITNNSSYDIDVQSYLESEPAIRLNGGVEVLIVHTHASESYYPDGDDMYQPTDVDRTEDRRYNVVRLGDRLTETLESQGFGVLHLREIFDSPTYNGSYTRTLAAIEQALDEHPGIKLVIDLHRDAMITAEDIKYRTVSQIDGRNAAQLMFIMGTDSGGLAHAEWRQNLTFAVHLQKYLVDSYPTLCRPIGLSSSRYNQHTTTASMILEVGTSANTLEEAEYAVQLFGDSLCEFLQNFTATG